DRQGRGRTHLAGGGLDEVGAGEHRQPGRAPDIVVGGQLAGLQDHLEVYAGRGLAYRRDLVEDLAVAAGEEGAAVDHHVDLVGAGGDRGGGLGDLDLQRRLAGREGGGDTGDADAGTGEFRGGGGDQGRVDADRRHRRALRVGRVGPLRLGAERPHLAGRVRALQRGEV